jgi:Uma2 family endonuclease
MAEVVTLPVVRVEEYLSTVYEPDCDYVDGELEDRNVGEKDHSKLQLRLQVLLSRIPEIHIFPEVRIRVAPTRFRVPDICVYPYEPDEQVFTTPPFLVIEILSPEDRMSRMMVKVSDYLQMGVLHIWMFDPRQKKAYWCDTDGIHEAKGRLKADHVSLHMADLNWT